MSLMNTPPDRSHHSPQRRSIRTVQQAVLCLGLLAGLPTLALAQDSPPAEPPAANSALSAPLFYQLLLGELNVSSGEPGTGYSLILDAARKQNDPDLFRRAVEIALQARSGDAALAAARAWSQAIPVSPEADRFELEILLALNRVGETGPVLRRLARRGPVLRRCPAPEFPALPRRKFRIFRLCGKTSATSFPARFSGCAGYASRPRTSTSASSPRT